MFGLFKKEENTGPGDVKIVRDTLLRFIKQELQKSEGGEGKNIKGIHLYILEDSADKHVYEAATYVDTPDQFKNEVQKIADDYAVDLPQNWTLEIAFTTDVPVEAT